jgi:hypothetical protein
MLYTSLTLGKAAIQYIGHTRVVKTVNVQRQNAFEVNTRTTVIKLLRLLYLLCYFLLYLRFYETVMRHLCTDY